MTIIKDTEDLRKKLKDPRTDSEKNAQEKEKTEKEKQEEEKRIKNAVERKLKETLIEFGLEDEKKNSSKKAGKEKERKKM